MDAFDDDRGQSGLIQDLQPLLSRPCSMPSFNRNDADRAEKRNMQTLPLKASSSKRNLSFKPWKSMSSSCASFMASPTFGTPSYPAPLDAIRAKSASLSTADIASRQEELNNNSLFSINDGSDDCKYKSQMEDMSSSDKNLAESLHSFSYTPNFSRGSFVSSPVQPLNSSLNASWQFFNFIGGTDSGIAPPTTTRNPNKALLTIDAKTSQILVANEIACNLFGYASEELTGMKMSKLFAMKDGFKQEALLEQHIDTEGNVVMVSGKVVEAVDSSGNVIAVSLWMKRFKSDDDPRCVAVIEPVQRSVGSILFNAEGTIIDCDCQFAYLHGYTSPEEVVGLLIQSLIPAIMLPIPGQEIKKHVKKQRATGKARNNSRFPVSVKISEYDKEFHEVYLRKGQYDDIQFSKFLYKGIVWVFSNISGLISVLPDGTIHSSNNNFSLMLFGCSEDDLVGKDITTLIPSFYDHMDLAEDRSLKIPSLSEDEEVQLDPNRDTGLSGRYVFDASSQSDLESDIDGGVDKKETVAYSTAQNYTLDSSSDRTATSSVTIGSSTHNVSDNNRVGHSFESPISRENATPRACSPQKSPYAVSNQGIESEIKESTTGLPSTVEDEEISNQSAMKRQVEQNQSLNSCLGPGLTVKSDSSYGVDSTGKISMDDLFNESCYDSKKKSVEKGFVKDSLIQIGSDGGDCEKSPVLDADSINVTYDRKRLNMTSDTDMSWRCEEGEALTCDEEKRYLVDELAAAGSHHSSPSAVLMFEPEREEKSMESGSNCSGYVADVSNAESCQDKTQDTSAGKMNSISDYSNDLNLNSKTKKLSEDESSLKMEIHSSSIGYEAENTSRSPSVGADSVVSPDSACYSQQRFTQRIENAETLSEEFQSKLLVNTDRKNAESLTVNQRVKVVSDDVRIDSKRFEMEGHSIGESLHQGNCRSSNPNSGLVDRYQAVDSSCSGKDTQSDYCAISEESIQRTGTDSGTFQSNSPRTDRGSDELITSDESTERDGRQIGPFIAGDGAIESDEIDRIARDKSTEYSDDNLDRHRNRFDTGYQLIENQDSQKDRDHSTTSESDSVSEGRGNEFVASDGSVMIDNGSEAVVDPLSPTKSKQQTALGDGNGKLEHAQSQLKFPFENVTSTPKLGRSDSPCRKMYEGNFFGQARHNDESLLSIVFQVKQITLNRGKELYCIWISRDLEDQDENCRLASQLMLTGSFNSTLNMPQFADAMKSFTDLSMSMNEDNLTLKGEYDQKYMTLKSIGKGAFGFVKLAKRRSDSLEVVVKFVQKNKIVPASWVDDPALGRVPLEIGFLAKLEHPNIVRMYEMFENEDFFQLVMEKHGEGIDLFEFIDRQPALDEPICAYMFKQIVAAVSYLHSKNILHRDVKDENIIIDKSFTLKLIDFGSAVFMEKEKLFSTFCGTVEYCSPEVLLGNKYRGPELEIWSLGITLYTVIFGENPFFDVEETIQAELRPPCRVSAELMFLVCWMLHPDPSLRASLKDVESYRWVNQKVDPTLYDYDSMFAEDRDEYSADQEDCGMRTLEYDQDEEYDDYEEYVEDHERLEEEYLRYLQRQRSLPEFPEREHGASF